MEKKPTQATALSEIASAIREHKTDLKIEVAAPNVQVSVLSKHEEVWLRAWTCVAGASDCKKVAIPEGWADACLRGFKKNFG